MAINFDNMITGKLISLTCNVFNKTADLSKFIAGLRAAVMPYTFINGHAQLKGSRARLYSNITHSPCMTSSDQKWYRKLFFFNLENRCEIRQKRQMLKQF